VPDEDRPLIDDLRLAGDGLTGSDVPSHQELPRIVGALIASSAENGLTVPEELLDPPTSQPSGPVDTSNVEDRLARMQARIDELESDRPASSGENVQPSPAAAPDPAPAGPAPAPSVDTQVAGDPAPPPPSAPGEAQA
jgi:hypothetical protein